MHADVSITCELAGSSLQSLVSVLKDCCRVCVCAAVTCIWMGAWTGVPEQTFLEIAASLQEGIAALMERVYSW